jgi:hypothetical protein
LVELIAAVSTIAFMMLALAGMPSRTKTVTNGDWFSL